MNLMIFAFGMYFQWLRLYSLTKLKLDLDKLVSGPDCKHNEGTVKTLHKHVSAK